MTNEGVWSAWSEISRISNGNLDNGHTRITSTWIGTHNNNNFSLGRQNTNDLIFAENDIRFNKALRSTGSTALSRQIESGNMLLNGANTLVNTEQEMWIGGRNRPGTTDRAVVLNNDNDSNGSNFNLGMDGTGSRIQSMAIYNRATTAATNVHVTANGVLSRSTSATKYKLDIKDVNADELPYRLLNVNLKSWYDKNFVERYSEYLTRRASGEKSSEYEACDYGYLERIYGVIAEDVVEAGLGVFAHWSLPDEEGNREIEGIQYERLWLLLIPIVRELSQEIKEQKEQLQILTDNIKKINEQILENKVKKEPCR